MISFEIDSSNYPCLKWQIVSFRHIERCMCFSSTVISMVICLNVENLGYSMRLWSAVENKRGLDFWSCQLTLILTFQGCGDFSWICGLCISWCTEWIASRKWFGWQNTNQEYQVMSYFVLLYIHLQTGIGVPHTNHLCSWSDAVLWNPHLQMEACYKDFVCVENAKAISWSFFRNLLCIVAKTSICMHFDVQYSSVTQIKEVELQPKQSWTATMQLSIA